MDPFVVLFTVIAAISLLLTLGIVFLRRYWGMTTISQEHINPAVFEFFTILYTIFIGFAIVTLWTAHLDAKSDINREATSLLTAYRIAKSIPGSEDFRRAIRDYAEAVIDREFPDMQQGRMSSEASQRFEDMWSRFYQLKAGPQKESDLHTLLAEASKQRISRTIILEGNLYPPVWAILIFGLIGVVFSLYFINREQTVVSVIFEFMTIFLVLACIYFIYDINSPFSGYIYANPAVFKHVLAKMQALQ